MQLKVLAFTLVASAYMVGYDTPYLQDARERMSHLLVPDNVCKVPDHGRQKPVYTEDSAYFFRALPTLIAMKICTLQKDSWRDGYSVAS